MKIAVACSGLGHISRGVETWASDTARSLHRAGNNVTLFKGGGANDPLWQQVLPCSKRFEPQVQRQVECLKRFGGWRYGFANGYQAEQTTFTWHLWQAIRRRYDILHVSDPWIGLLMTRLHRLGLSRPRVVLAHGTDESPAFLRQFMYLQLLAPPYLEQWETYRPAGQKVYMIPNPVNVDTFRPGDRGNARQYWNLPTDSLIVLCVAAIRQHHKRIDALIREFASFAATCSQQVTLVIAGAREKDTDQLIKMGQDLLGNRIRFFVGVEHEKMPLLYQAADIFTLASLHEMFGIAITEAMASGLSIACNDTPVFRWIVGPAGHLNDISQVGALAAQLAHLSDPGVRRRLTLQATTHVQSHFAETVVEQQVTAMYKDIMGVAS
jgi:glycosyltransferase involved in cell wall biosynthesis